MKSVLYLTIGLMLLLAGNEASAQRQRNPRGGPGGPGGPGNFNYGGYGRNAQATYTGDPRVRTDWGSNSFYGTNGFEIISENNIFNPNRFYSTPRVAGPPPVPSYNFTVNGILTDGAHGAGYVFFYGNSVQNRGYTNSETINGFKISDIENNSVTMVDTNSKSFTLKVGAGFSKLGTNDWRFLPVPELTAYTSTTPTDDGADASDGAPAGPMSDAMRRLMERRKAEMGDTPAPAAGDDAAAPMGDAPPTPPPGDEPPGPRGGARGPRGDAPPPGPRGDAPPAPPAPNP